MPFNPFAAGPAEPVAEPSPAEPADGGATRESDVDDGWWDFGSGPDAADATPDPDPADDAADDGRRDADGRGGRSEDAPDPMPDDGADDDWWGMAGGDGPRSDDADPTPRLVSVPGTSVRIPADFDWGTDTLAAGPADGVREPAPASARRPGPSRRILIAVTAAILALALLAGGVVAARTLIASDRQRKAHDEACATLTAQAGTWDGLARQAKTLGVKPGDGPDTSCKADTDTLKARARTLKTRARTLAKANRNALDAAWRDLTGRIAASRKNHPKAGGQTLAALETLAETAPEDADGLAAKEREFERLDKQAGQEQQKTEQEEKAEAEAKRKAEQEAEARREAEQERSQAQDTPQAVTPTPAPQPTPQPTPTPAPQPTPTPMPAPGNADASM